MNSPNKLSIEDGRKSLNSHVASKGEEIREKYGTDIGWNELQQILQDRSFVRYPCAIEFDAKPLEEGEFAYPLQKTERPEDGFIIYVHPFFSLQLARVPHLVLYQLVAVNYGAFASAEDAEIFGASALGMAQDDYYNLLCQMTDEITENLCGT